MNGDISMRYAPKRDVTDKLVERWRGHAKEVMFAMEDL